MTSAPVIEWRSSITPFGTIASVAITGSGSSGAVPIGTSSNVATVRLYNNFAAAGSIADATSCVLTSYDDTVHQGIATTVPVTSQYLLVQVVNYNGSTTSADTQYFAIGGSTRHAIPTNSGTLSGTGANYVTINIKINAPSTATQGAISQGLWLEYTSTA